MVKLPENGVLVRIFVGEKDYHQGKPIYEQIVLKAKELNMAGATVIRGIMGFGAGSRVLHTAKFLRLSEDLPMVVEIVDTKEKIDQLLPFLDEIVEEGMITMENVKVLKYKFKEEKKS